MWETLRNVWRVPELRKKVLYTFFMLLIYRLVSVIPAPGIDVATVQTLLDAGLIKKTLDGVKILGGGELEKKLTVSVDKVTESAKQKIEAIGGKVEVK